MLAQRLGNLLFANENRFDTLQNLHNIDTEPQARRERHRTRRTQMRETGDMWYSVPVAVKSRRVHTPQRRHVPASEWEHAGRKLVL